eukprot:GHVL01034347.1.p1 GENE.GHVL01034347.1~~GHVL01034347.1.p1  ORF type:complete len:448 (+),score=56.30 GHVL01034347.1:1287-2630(+)
MILGLRPCGLGYEFRFFFPPTCIDINECLNLTNPVCGSDSTCINLPGHYECICASGYKAEGERHSRKCIDIDECSEGTHNCHQFCENLPGYFKCYCLPGFFSDPDGSCIPGGENNPECKEDGMTLCFPAHENDFFWKGHYNAGCKSKLVEVNGVKMTCISTPAMSIFTDNLDADNTTLCGTIRDQGDKFISLSNVASMRLGDFVLGSASEKVVEYEIECLYHMETRVALPVRKAEHKTLKIANKGEFDFNLRACPKKNEGHCSDNNPTEMEVTDTMQVEISAFGSGQFLHFQKCTAMSDSKKTNTFELIENFCALEQSKMVGLKLEKNSNKELQKFEIGAFSFSGGSLVEIQCQVVACQTEDCLGTVKKTCSNFKRRLSTNNALPKGDSSILSISFAQQSVDGRPIIGDDGMVLNDLKSNELSGCRYVLKDLQYFLFGVYLLASQLL